jgi:hypothetical protein
VALAEQLGLKGEAFALSEKIAQTREEFERVLEGYLRSELVPFAVRLGSRLMDEAALPAPLLRLLAERLAPTQQGAALAVRAWPMLLSAEVVDVDGWTLFAEALRKSGRESAAAMADGFGAALSSTAGATSSVKPSKLAFTPSSQVAPEGAVAVTNETMPRLFAALQEALMGFGADGLSVVLDVEGGVEAWLGGTKLVLGAGALTVFGQAELPALVAVALALGESGVALRRIGEVSGFTEAAVRAFQSYPASLAFLRVLAQLDTSVRGSDPAKVDVGAVLRQSPAFRAVALAAVESLRGQG